jgi:hypothetical protein
MGAWRRDVKWDFPELKGPIAFHLRDAHVVITTWVLASESRIA